MLLLSAAPIPGIGTACRPSIWLRTALPVPTPEQGRQFRLKRILEYHIGRPVRLAISL